MPWDAPPKYRSPIELRGYELLGAQLRRRRQQLGLSQRQLAALSRIDQSVISRTENGKQFGFRWSRFARLVGVLGGLGGEPIPSWAAVNDFLAQMQ
jgi:transcriptional regulator with XRE-family HTH domain